MRPHIFGQPYTSPASAVTLHLARIGNHIMVCGLTFPLSVEATLTFVSRMKYRNESLFWGGGGSVEMDTNERAYLDEPTNSNGNDQIQKIMPKRSPKYGDSILRKDSITCD
jgi:hypothetical protein